MPISLSSDVERQITERVESGEFECANEVIRYAMALLAREDEENATHLDALRCEIQKGIDDLENGRHSPIEEAFARIKAGRGMATT